MKNKTNRSYKSYKSYRSYGFTLIEVIVGFLMFVFIATLGITVSIESFRFQNFRNEINLIAGVLQRARAMAQNNINQISHGVCFDSIGKQYVLFEGVDCQIGTNKQYIPMQIDTVVEVWPTTGVVFNQLTGNCVSSCPVVINLSLNNQSATIKIFENGSIDY